MAQTNRQFILDEIPEGVLTPEHFRLAQGETPRPGEGEVLLRAPVGVRRVAEVVIGASDLQREAA